MENKQFITKQEWVLDRIKKFPDENLGDAERLYDKFYARIYNCKPLIEKEIPDENSV